MAPITPPNPHPPADPAKTDEPTATADTNASSRSKKRKRTEKPHILYTTTFKKPNWTYMRLELVTPDTAASLPQAQTQPPSQSQSQSSAIAAPAPAPTISISSSNPSSSTPTPPTSHPVFILDDIATDVEFNTDTDSIDPLTVSTLLTPALTSFLGLTGSAIPIDILKTSGREVWIRVARQDARAVQASLARWIGVCGRELIPGVGDGDGGKEVGKVKVAWRVKGVGGGLGGLGGDGDGQGLFG